MIDFPNNITNNNKNAILQFMSIDKKVIKKNPIYQFS